MASITKTLAKLNSMLLFVAQLGRPPTAPSPRLPDHLLAQDRNEARGRSSTGFEFSRLGNIEAVDSWA
jgi:hypothetical protein